MSQTKAQLVSGLNLNPSAPATALQIDASGNINLDSNTLYVDAANNRVGLGTSSPGSRLTVNRVNFANASATGSTTLNNAGITVEAATDTNNRLMFGIGSTGGSPWIQAQNTSSNATQSLILNPVGGNVGIGTTSPADGLGYGTALDIRGSGTGNGGVVYLRNSDASVTGFVAAFGDGRMDLGTSTNHPLKFITNSNERARIDTSGRLLVGTSTSPSSGFGQYAKLVVQGQPADATAGGNFSIQRGEAAAGGNITSGEGIGNISWNDNAGNTFGLIGCEADANAGTNDYPGRLVFSTTADGASSPTERMRIASNGICSLPDGGVIGIGTSGAIMSSSGRIRIHGDFFNGASGLALSTTDNSNNAIYIDFGSSTGTRVGQVRRASSTSIAYDTTSDYRLKENITPFQNAIERLSQLNPVRFSWIVDAKKAPDVDGFLAHEVQQVVPEAAGGFKDQIDADGSPVYQGIDQSKLVPLLTAALQETIAELQALKAEVASLKAS